MLKVSITSGMGPVEVQEFVRLLKDRFIALLGEGGHIDSIVEYPGSGPGLLMYVEILCSGAGLEKLLASESGTHALIKRTELRPGHKRKRWFAGVHVVECNPDTDAAVTSEPVLSDLKITTALAGGPGGQNVNKRSTKVQVLHVPTGISVSCARERSQSRNRQLALQLLGRKIEEAGQAKRSAAARQDWLRKLQVERGNPVRTYRDEGGVLSHA